MADSIPGDTNVRQTRKRASNNIYVQNQSSNNQRWTLRSHQIKAEPAEETDYILSDDHHNAREDLSSCLLLQFKEEPGNDYPEPTDYRPDSDQPGQSLLRTYLRTSGATKSGDNQYDDDIYNLPATIWNMDTETCTNETTKLRKTKIKQAYNCKKCDQTFDRRKKLKTHKKEAHKKNKKTKKMGDKRQTGDTNSGDDEMEETGENDNSMDEEGRGPAESRSSSSSPNALPFNCEECGKAFATGGRFKNHLETHKPGAVQKRKDQHKCDTCSKTFSALYLLKQHLMTHTEMAGQLRQSYSLRKKLDAIAYAEKHGNRSAGRQFLVDESCVRKWRQLKSKLQALPHTNSTCRGGGPRYPDMEQQLSDWVTESRQSGVIVTTVMMRARAVEMSKDLGYSSFSACPAWGARFMSRNGLSIRVASEASQPRPAEWRELAREFQLRLATSIERKFIPPSNIYSMDEVGMAFDWTNGRTVDIVGSPDVRLILSGLDKMGCSILLCCSRDGQKLPPFIIFKSVPIEQESFPAEVKVHGNLTGWMDEPAMLQWVSRCWARRTCARHPRRSLLLMDTLSAQQTPGVVASLKLNRTELRLIPQGMSSLLQPLDAAVTHMFKAGLKRSWSAWLANGLHMLTPDGQMYPASPTEIVQWVADAWNAISAECIMASFRYCLEEEVGVGDPIVEKDGLDFHRTGTEGVEAVVVVDSDDSSSGEESGWSGLSDASPPGSPPKSPQHTVEQSLIAGSF